MDVAWKNSKTRKPPRHSHKRYCRLSSRPGPGNSTTFSRPRLSPRTPPESSNWLCKPRKHKRRSRNLEPRSNDRGVASQARKAGLTSVTKGIASEATQKFRLCRDNGLAHSEASYRDTTFTATSASARRGHGRFTPSTPAATHCYTVDRLILRCPVRRVLKTAILGTCTPQADCRMFTLYGAERLTSSQVDAFAERIARALAAWQRPPRGGPQWQKRYS